MRTTVTLDGDTEALVRRRMRERGVSFKQALNDAIREGATGRAERGSFRTEVHQMGVPAVNLDRAPRLAADLEDDEALRRMGTGN